MAENKWATGGLFMEFTSLKGEKYNITSYPSILGHLWLQVLTSNYSFVRSFNVDDLGGLSTHATP